MTIFFYFLFLVVDKVAITRNVDLIDTEYRTLSTSERKKHVYKGEKITSKCGKGTGQDSKPLGYPHVPLQSRSKMM